MNDDRDLGLGDELRQLLADRVAGPPRRPDWDDLADRLARRHRRQTRLFAAVAVFALVTGSVAGFVAGRAGTDTNEEVAVDAGEGGVTETDDDTTTATTVADAASGMSVATEELAAPFNPGGPGSYRLVDARDVGDIRARLYSVDVGTYDDGNPFWEAPPECFTASLIVELSTPAVAASEWVDVYAPAAGGEPGSHLGLVGMPEGDPLWYATVRVDPTATEVAIAFPGGGTDAAIPVDGTAVLVARAPGDADIEDLATATATATVRGPDGATATHEVSSTWYRIEPAIPPPQCIAPPVTLPPAGEQPADPDAARQAIEYAYSQVYGTVGETAGRVFLEDPAALEDAFARLDEQGLPVPDGATITVHITELVFDTPEHAWLLYDLEVETLSTFAGRVGEAMVVDGQWRMANATICHDLALAGVTC